MACRLQIFSTLGPSLLKLLLGTATDRPAKVTDCTVTLLGLPIQSGSPYLGQVRYLLQTGLFD